MAAGTYADNLREALAREGWSQLRLVKELAARTGNAVESERSSVRGYLKGALPRPERARMIAEILQYPDLAAVQNPRNSAIARVDAHLEALAANDVEILANQELLLRGQEALLDELQSIRATLDSLLAASRTPTTQSGGGQ